MIRGTRWLRDGARLKIVVVNRYAHYRATMEAKEGKKAKGHRFWVNILIALHLNTLLLELLREDHSDSSASHLLSITEASTGLS